eukprot:scaffold10803_cov133-Isochrysis_galbana.AAC.8
MPTSPSVLESTARISRSSGCGPKAPHRAPSRSNILAPSSRTACCDLCRRRRACGSACRGRTGGWVIDVGEGQDGGWHGGLTARRLGA